MADINATDLTQETASTMDGNEQIIMFDSAEGKRATVKAVGDYIIQQVASSLNGSNQTLAAALSALNSKFDKPATMGGFSDLSSYTDSNNMFTVPKHGYLQLNNNAGDTGECIVYGTNTSNPYCRFGKVEGRFMVYICPGARCYLNGSCATFRFVPVE